MSDLLPHSGGGVVPHLPHLVGNALSTLHRKCRLEWADSFRLKLQLHWTFPPFILHIII